MKDARIAIFRRTLEGLLDSLDATLRVGQWTGADGVPDLLKESAGQLVDRLGAANRLASSRFSGSSTDAARVKVIAEAVRRLDATYVAYCRSSSRDRELATRALEAELRVSRQSV
ncbi:MAG: hypothetical protein HY908_28800 [Myxococcales bacterium]|nr:hypothetical protein [Myxococcales bacterium]